MSPLGAIKDYCLSRRGKDPLPARLESVARGRARDWSGVFSTVSRMRGNPRKHAGSALIALTPEGLSESLREAGENAPRDRNELLRLTGKVNDRVRWLLVRSVDHPEELAA